MRGRNGDAGVREIRVAGIAAGAFVSLVNGLIVALLGVNPFITTSGAMVLVRDHRSTKLENVLLASHAGQLFRAQQPSDAA